MFACLLLLLIFVLFVCLFILFSFVYFFLSLLPLGYCKQSLNNNNNNILMKKSKVPSWSQAQLKEAITCILTQQLRFTQASTKFKIPKGTLYDNILGKTKRSRMLEEVGLNTTVYISSTINTDYIFWQLKFIVAKSQVKLRLR